jgi:hypothetical protein
MPTLLRELEQHELDLIKPVNGGEITPIVNGKYETKISTTYSSPQEGIDEIKLMIQKSRRLRISSIPMQLLNELTPLLKDKDLMIILPQNEKPSEDLKKLAPIATTKARIYVDYMRQEANTGSINFASQTFNIVWLGDKILGVSAMEYNKCSKCMIEAFESGWHYAQKW